MSRGPRWARAAIPGAWLLLSALALATQSPRQSGAVPAHPATAHGPIIDMHLHAFGWNAYGDPPPPNEKSGRVPDARSDEEALAATLAALDRHGIVLAAVSGLPDQLNPWRRAAPDRFLAGAYVSGRAPLPDVDAVRAEVEAGRLQMIGELGLQYRGLAADDPEVEGLFALAAELDLPVGLHTGLSDAGTPYGCCPAFRARLGSPLLVEDVLVRHPTLRLYLMHAGYPFLDETIAVLAIYPQVYVDIAVLNWALPRAEFHRYLKALVTAGFGRRILFGSDQMIWPEAIGMAIEGVATADFLDDGQKRDIFYWNAARFLRLDDARIEAHHRPFGAAVRADDPVEPRAGAVGAPQAGIVAVGTTAALCADRCGRSRNKGGVVTRSGQDSRVALAGRSWIRRSTMTSRVVQHRVRIDSTSCVVSRIGNRLPWSCQGPCRSLVSSWIAVGVWSSLEARRPSSSARPRW